MIRVCATLGCKSRGFKSREFKIRAYRIPGFRTRVCGIRASRRKDARSLNSGSLPVTTRRRNATRVTTPIGRCRPNRRRNRFHNLLPSPPLSRACIRSRPRRNPLRMRRPIRRRAGMIRMAAPIIRPMIRAIRRSIRPWTCRIVRAPAPVTFPSIR